MPACISHKMTCKPGRGTTVQAQEWAWGKVAQGCRGRPALGLGKVVLGHRGHSVLDQGKVVLDCREHPALVPRLGELLVVQVRCQGKATCC